MPEAATIFAGLSLLILYTVTIIGGGVWLQNQLKGLKEEILMDFTSKHNANDKRYEALNTIVIRHDTILNPEWRTSYHDRTHK